MHYLQIAPGGQWYKHTLLAHNWHSSLGVHVPRREAHGARSNRGGSVLLMTLHSEVLSAGRDIGNKIIQQIFSQIRAFFIFIIKKLIPTGFL